MKTFIQYLEEAESSEKTQPEKSFEIIEFDPEIHTTEINKIDDEEFGIGISMDELKQLKGFVYMVKDDGEDKLDGYILVDPLDVGTHIRSLAINSNKQRKGIGSQLLEKVEEEYQEPFSLCIDPDFRNPDGLRIFYSRHGYKFSGEYTKIGNEIWTKGLPLNK